MYLDYRLLTKSVLVPLRLTSAASATDAHIQKKIFGSHMTALIISDEEMNIMKIVKSLEECGLLIKMKQKNKKTDFSVCY